MKFRDLYKRTFHQLECCNKRKQLARRPAHHFLKMYRDLNNQVRNSIEEILALSREFNLMTCNKIGDSLSPPQDLFKPVLISDLTHLLKQDEPTYFLIWLGLMSPVLCWFLTWLRPSSKNERCFSVRSSLWLRSNSCSPSPIVYLAKFTFF